MEFFKRSKIIFTILIIIGVISATLLIFCGRIFYRNSKIDSSMPAVSQSQGSTENRPVSINGAADENMDKRENGSQIGVDMDKHIGDLGIKGEKIAYLTFDDGPSIKTTPKILDTLKSYNVKATFFVVGKLAEANRDLIIRENAEGNAIGDHTFTHDYKYLYQNPQIFISDISKCAETLHSILGAEFKIKYIRFPGGSFGKKLEPFREAVEAAGYSFIDWNSLNGDAEGANIPPDKLVSRIKQTSKGKNTLVILMHDAPAKKTTVQALPQIIEYLKSEGFIFKTLN